VRTSFLSTGRQRTLAVVVAAVIVAFGTRELFFGSLPMVGQLAPLLGWSASWHHFFSGWQASGVGTTAPSSPAFGIVGIAGTVLLGSMGLVQKVLLLGCLPVGAWGLSRFMRPLVSPRARVVGAICYLGLPLPYGALGSGRWDGLVAYAALPFIVGRLARAAAIPPFDRVTGHGWRAGRFGQAAALGAIIAAASSFAPAVLPMTIVCAVALALGSLMTGQPAPAGRLAGETAKAVGMALLLCAPWVVGVLLAGQHSVAIFGLPISAGAAPGWGELTRFAIGPAVRSPVAWALVAGSALPLFFGKGIRLVWAARLWTMACASWVLAFAATHGWTGSFTPSESVVLVPAAIAVAAGVGLGVSTFENDLAGLAFGWRQIVSGFALVAVLVGLLPVVAGAVGGRWGLASTGVEQPLSFLDRAGTVGAYRTLWLGDPRALPVGGWSVQPGLAFALTAQELPDAADVWTPAGPGPATLVSRALRLAMAGGTVHLGQLLAAQGVQYIVVVDGLAPSETGVTPSVAAPPPKGIQQALLSQNDLQIVPGTFGVQVFRNADAISLTAERNRPLTATAATSWPGVSDIVGWHPVLSAVADRPGATGVVAAGAVYAGYAPAGDFSLTQHGRSSPRKSAYGWAEEYPTAAAGVATFSLKQFPYVPLAVLVEVLGWAVLAAALLGWSIPRRRARPEDES
jgi:hypothetical protein